MHGDLTLSLLTTTCYSVFARVGSDSLALAILADQLVVGKLCKCEYWTDAGVICFALLGAMSSKFR
jgi:hypothetical protein